MQTIKEPRIEALEEIYLTLAEFYKDPINKLFKELASGTIEARLKELFQIVGYSYPSVNITNGFTSLDKMKESYMHCFLGITSSYAPPIESVYKVWTTDPSANMAMAQEKGYVFGDSALHIQHLFAQFNLEIPKQYASTPDHLTLLLEFLVYLVEQRSDKEVYQFLIDHFDWLEDFKKELTNVQLDSFYVDVTEIVIQAINEELEGLKQIVPNS